MRLKPKFHTKLAKNNKTYKFSEDWWERIRLMDISERGIIITAICERVFEGRCREQVLPEYKQRVLDSILADVEKQLQHASEVSRKRAQAGSGGMAKRWNTSGKTNMLRLHPNRCALGKLSSTTWSANVPGAKSNSPTL